MEKLGFNLVPGEHPIIPVMLGDAKLAKTMADELLKEGIYVIGFSYPVVPHGKHVFALKCQQLMKKNILIKQLNRSLQKSGAKIRSDINKMKALVN